MMANTMASGAPFDTIVVLFQLRKEERKSGNEKETENQKMKKMKVNYLKGDERGQEKMKSRGKMGGLPQNESKKMRIKEEEERKEDKPPPIPNFFISLLVPLVLRCSSWWKASSSTRLASRRALTVLESLFQVFFSSALAPDFSFPFSSFLSLSLSVSQSCQED